MLERTPDNKGNTPEEGVSFSQLTYTSNQPQLLQALSFASMESAGLDELERVLDISLEWPKVTQRFQTVARALLEDPEPSVLGFKARLSQACANILNQLSGEICTHALPKAFNLLSITHLVIDTITLSTEVRELPDFARLPEAYLNFSRALFDKRHDREVYQDIKIVAINTLIQQIIPALDEVDMIDWSLRREISGVIRRVLADEQLYTDITSDNSESYSHWLNVLELARIAQSRALVPALCLLTEHLSEAWQESVRPFGSKYNSDVVGALLASALSALSVSGNSPKANALFRGVFSNAERLSPVWNEAFLALSRESLKATYDELSIVVSAALDNIPEADYTLLQYLHIPGALGAVRSEFSHFHAPERVAWLGRRYYACFGNAPNSDTLQSGSGGYLTGLPLAQSQELLATLFASYGWLP